MTLTSKIRTIGLFLIIAFLGVLLSVPLACAGSDTMLDTGTVVNAKMKSVAAGAVTSSRTETSDIKAIRMADSLPDGFVPTDTNTVSIPDSGYPIYIFFDNTDDAGIMYFYTKGNTVSMNPNSYFLFAGNTSLTDISGLAGWDASHVTDMCSLFSRARSLPDALAIRNWDTSSVEDMSYMFSCDASLMLVDVSNWNTGKVTDMTCMFQVGDNHAGNGQLCEINGLGDLDVSNVRDMTCMFYGAGHMTYYDVSRWNVSKVESMNHMFCDNYKLVSLDLSGWDVSSVKTVYCMFDDCQELKTIGDVSHWNTASLIDAGGWLNWAISFIGNNEGILDLSGWDTHNLKAAGEMFLRTQLYMIDLTGWTFDSITNEKWEGAGRGIYYETGNGPEELRGFGQMFKDTKNLKTVYISQEGLDSFTAAVEKEINTLDMWTGSKADGFTVK